MNNIKDSVPNKTVAKYRLIDIKIIKFNINYNPEFIRPPESFVDYSFDIGFKEIIDRENKLIHLLNDVVIFSNDENKFELGSIRTVNIFEIENFDETIKIEGKKHRIPKMFLACLIGIAFSNTRGILYAKSSGSILNGVLLPIISPLKIITEAEKKKSNKT